MEDFEGFNIKMVLVDAIPVIVFGINAVMIGLKIHNDVFMIGAFICLGSACLKVTWKLVLALRKIDLKLLSKQFKYVMGLGFMVMAIAPFVSPTVSLSDIWNHISLAPSAAFFVMALGAACFMVYMARHMDMYDVKKNWQAQYVNILLQLLLLLGILYS